MSLYKNFKTDTSSEVEGIEVTYPANDDGTIPTFRLARMGGANKKYQRELERRTRPYARQMQNGTMSGEKADEVFLDVFIRTVLLGWDNVQDIAGKVVPFSQAAAKTLLTDLPDLYDDLVERAKNMTLFQIEERREEAGNS